MFSLNDQVALITGATGGIGREIAKTLHSQGATIAISGTRENVLNELAAELGERVYVFSCNLADKASVEALVPSVEDKLGKIDILVNNAGITKDSLIMRMKDSDWQDVIDVNLTSTFLLCRAVSKGMMKCRHGRIINIASVVGFTGNPGQVNYVASKAGMVGLSKSLALELATRGITVNCVAPGFISSAMTDTLSDTVKETILGNIPMKRMGTADEIATAVAFLSAKETAYITGQTIHVNGGMSCI